jgi:DNA-binding MarR family transcriptional regulator
MSDSDGRWLADDEQDAWRVYVRGHARLMAELHRRLVAASGLGLTDYEVLVHLSEATDGRLRSFELAEAMQWERSRLTHHLTRMEQRALIVRRRCDDDGRGSYVELTRDGRRSLERAAPRHAADVRELFVDPAGSSLLSLARASRRIGAAVSSEE